MSRNQHTRVAPCRAMRVPTVLWRAGVRRGLELELGLQNTGSFDLANVQRGKGAVQSGARGAETSLSGGEPLWCLEGYLLYMLCRSGQPVAVGEALGVLLFVSLVDAVVENGRWSS